MSVHSTRMQQVGTRYSPRIHEVLTRYTPDTHQIHTRYSPGDLKQLQGTMRPMRKSGAKSRKRHAARVRSTVQRQPPPPPNQAPPLAQATLDVLSLRGQSGVERPTQRTSTVHAPDGIRC